VEDRFVHQNNAENKFLSEIFLSFCQLVSEFSYQLTVHFLRDRVG